MGSVYRPYAPPFDVHIVDNRVQFRGDIVVLIFWKDDSPAVVADIKGVQDVGHVAHVAAIRGDCAFFADTSHRHTYTALWSRRGSDCKRCQQGHSGQDGRCEEHFKNVLEKTLTCDSDLILITTYFCRTIDTSTA